MKNKIVLLSTFILMTLSLTACDKYKEDISYDTDLYGVYVYEINDTEVDYYSLLSYTINENDTFIYKYLQNSNDISKEEQYNGNIDILNVSNDIDEITFDISNSYREEVLYKYKNMLGDFYETNVPKGKTFDLIIPMIINGVTEQYFVFKKNGFSYICLDINDCNDSPEDHMIYYNYIRKGNVIYIQMPNYEISDYFIHAYITDGGLFYPQYYKEEK